MAAAAAACSSLMFASRMASERRAEIGGMSAEWMMQSAEPPVVID